MASATPLHRLGDRDRSFIERVCVAHSESLLVGGAVPIEARLLEANLRQRPALLLELLVLELEGALARRALPTRSALESLHPGLVGGIREAYPQLPPHLRLPERVGPYTVERFVADGGQARAVVGRDAREKVALLKYGEGPEAQRQLSREAESLSRLRHRRIRRVVAHGAEGGLFYLALEYLVGRNLADLAEGAPLAPRLAARLLLDVAGALAYVHAQGYLHRDLKPHNVVVDPRGRATLIDFALAIDENRGGEARAPLLERGGTRAYMAPEHLAGDPHASGVRSDLYGLGAVLGFALTGEHPAEQGKISARMASVPGALRRLCLRATATDPAARHGSVAEFLSELRGYLRRDRWWRWGRAAAVSLLLAAVAGPPLGSAAAPFLKAMLYGKGAPWYEQLAAREGLSFGELSRESFVLAVARGPRDPIAPRGVTRYALTVAAPEIPAALRARLGVEAQVGSGPWRPLAWRSGEVARLPLTSEELRLGNVVRLRLVSAFGVAGAFEGGEYEYPLTAPEEARRLASSLGASFEEACALEWVAWNGSAWEFSPGLAPERLAAIGSIEVLDDVSGAVLLREAFEDGALLTASGSVRGVEAARVLGESLAGVGARVLRVTLASDENQPEVLTRVFRAL